MLIIKTPLDNKIVLYGMSCVGKTTFAKQLINHYYYCFDALFHWHAIETLGLSIESNFKYIQEYCKEEKYVIDGWHLADHKGEFLPTDAVFYMIFADYDTIIDQYRIEVTNRDEFREMYEKWYGKTPIVKKTFFNNGREFIEY